MHMREMMILGLSFLAFMLSCVWPRVCVERFQTRLGRSPASFSEMRKMDPVLYNWYVAGLVVSTALGLAFFGLAVVATIGSMGSDRGGVDF